MRIKRPTRNTRQRRPRFGQNRRKVCRFCADKVRAIDYKDMRTMESFVKERGKIVSARSSGNCAKHQRQLNGALKRARFIALIPYVRI
jgi:small subunit ribosomal protein S18